MDTITIKYVGGSWDGEKKIMVNVEDLCGTQYTTNTRGGHEAIIHHGKDFDSLPPALKRKEFYQYDSQLSDGNVLFCRFVRSVTHDEYRKLWDQLTN